MKQIPTFFLLQTTILLSIINQVQSTCDGTPGESLEWFPASWIGNVQGYCVNDPDIINDNLVMLCGVLPPYEPVVKFDKLECCEFYYPWVLNECLGIAPQSPPDGPTLPGPTPPNPTPTPPSPPINNGSNNWYRGSWPNNNKCVRDCPSTSTSTSSISDCGGLAPSWETTYPTAFDCCSSKLSSQITNICVSNSDSFVGIYTGSNLYYPKNNKCLKDCAIGSELVGVDYVCGGILLEKWQTNNLYENVTSCCSDGVGGSVDLDYCVGNSDPNFLGTGKYYVDFSRGYCIKDLDEVNCPSNEVCQQNTAYNTKFYPEIISCCASLSSYISIQYCEASGSYTNYWFSYGGGNICKKDCNPNDVVDGSVCANGADGTTKFYESASDCCEDTTFGLGTNYCRATSVGEEYLGTNKYYLGSWPNNNKCLQDCPISDAPPQPGDGICNGVRIDSSTYLFNTTKSCCQAKLSYLDTAYCEDQSLAISTGTGMYFLDSRNTGLCIKDTDDCQGSDVCGRAIISSKLYANITACCGASSSTQELCESRSIGEVTNLWFQVTQPNELCVKDCDPTSPDAPPECQEVPSMTTTLYANVEECCSGRDFPEYCDTMSNGEYSNKYYYDTSKMICSQSCIGTLPCSGQFPKDSSTTLYDDLETCCSEKLSWIRNDVCVSNARGEEPGNTGKYYYQLGDCVADCPRSSDNADCGGTVANWVMNLYPDRITCCDRNSCRNPPPPSSLGAPSPTPPPSDTLQS